jgi:hypothetical protein
MSRYTRNINVKNYTSIEDIYDSVNNDPKRPGWQIAYLDRASNHNSLNKWRAYLSRQGYNFTEKRPKLNGAEYVALITQATPEQVTALKICF